MAKTFSASTLSPFQFAGGREIFTEDVKAVHDQLSYSFARTRTPLLCLNPSYDSAATDMSPHDINNNWFGSGYDTVYDSVIFIPHGAYEDFNVSVAATCHVPGTSTLGVRVTIGSDTPVVLSFSATGRQSTSIAMSDIDPDNQTIAGVCPVLIETSRTAGLDNGGRLKNIVIQLGLGTTAMIPDPDIAKIEEIP